MCEYLLDVIDEVRLTNHNITPRSSHRASRTSLSSCMILVNGVSDYDVNGRMNLFPVVAETCVLLTNKENMNEKIHLIGFYYVVCDNEVETFCKTSWEQRFPGCPVNLVTTVEVNSSEACGPTPKLSETITFLPLHAVVGFFVLNHMRSHPRKLKRGCTMSVDLQKHMVASPVLPWWVPGNSIFGGFNVCIKKT